MTEPTKQTLPLEECLVEVTSGIGARWKDFPVLGATRDGLAPAKEPVGKNPQRYKYVHQGTIFYNPMRILIGSIAMIDVGDRDGITSPDYVVFKTVETKLNSRWFYFWLRSIKGENYIRGLARGAVRERMLFKRLVQGSIAAPSINKQNQIADALLVVRNARRKAEEQISEINSLAAALLRSGNT